MAGVSFYKQKVQLTQRWIEISSKFSVRIDLHIAKRVLLRKWKPEVDFRRYGRYLEKSIWRHISATRWPILWNLVRRCKMHYTHNDE